MTILGAVEIRKPHQLEKMQVCLSSLRRHNPHTSIVIFNRSPHDVELAALLDRYTATSVNVNGWEESDWGPLTSRNLYYETWLRGAVIAPGPIVMIDIFDVVAQGNLDALSCDQLTVAQENHQLGDCPYNATWLRESFQITPPDPLLCHPIVCCGVVAGPRTDVLAYLAWFRTMLTTQERTQYPLDQSALNLYVYDPAHAVSILPYVNPLLMHVGYGEAASFQWADGRVSCHDTTPLLLHQYNRHRHMHRYLKHTYWEAL